MPRENPRPDPKNTAKAAPESTPSDEPELLPAPPASIIALMKAHLCAEHGYSGFRLKRDLYLGGERKASQHLIWNPLDITFRCNLCPRKVFWTGTITEKMVRGAQLFDPAIGAQLTGLVGQADRDEMTRHQLEGTASREELRHLRGADARRRRAKGKRPVTEERRRRLQTWMLEQVRIRDGLLEPVLEEAERLQREDRETWAKLSERPLSAETLRDYWQDIPIAEREAARAEGRKRAEKSTR
jgi:hypothetical protein